MSTFDDRPVPEPLDPNDCLDPADMPCEHWLPVPGFEGLYEVSDLGRVRSIAREVPRLNADGSPAGIKRVKARIRRPGVDPKGYRKVVVFDKQRIKTFRVHKLVLEAFVGPCPEGQESRHKNGRNDDNRLENLQYGTPSQNTYDRVEHGTHFQARRSHCIRDHPLIGQNLSTSAHRGKSRRQCKSCNVASRSFSRKLDPTGFRAAADAVCARLLGNEWRELYPSGLRDSLPTDPCSRATSEAVRRTMVGNRSSDTSPETAMRKELRQHGLVGYRLRWPVPGAPRRTIDVAFVKHRLAVFVDGCFWHGCPEHGSVPKSNREYWFSKLERNAERDSETNGMLESAGWTVLRFWSHQDPRNCVEAIGRVLDQGPTKPKKDPA